MSLFLAESVLPASLKEKTAFEGIVENLNETAEKNKGKVVEVQVSQDFSRAFFILQVEKQDEVYRIFRELRLPLNLVKEVRLLGQQLDEVVTANKNVRYIVEWNLPSDLTMERYLKRKKENSVKYEEVPEVEFIRTYVCEDLTKCVCFYDAPDVETVEKARKVVGAPIDSLTETTKINNKKNP